MTTTTYARYELLRTVRNTRFFVLSLVFPLVLFVLIAGPNRHQQLGGISFPLYYMSGMAAWGTMSAVIAGGARIAAERSVGWNRQLRLTPLTTTGYVGTKIVTIGLLYSAGASMGVRLPATRWATMTLLILVGLVPFAALGIALGHVLTVESMGPAMGGITSLLALLGGAWGPVGDTGVVHSLVQLLPSYWLVQAATSAIAGGSWPARGWLVMAGWTAVLSVLAVRAFRRDTERV